MSIGRSWDRAPFISGAAGPSLPLDVIPGSVAAYSNRKLRTAYAGKSINAVRVSDNATQDIGFIGTSFDAASYAGFIGGSTGRNGKWYDQSNANDAVQATLASQPPYTLVDGFYGNTTSGGLTIYMPAPDSVSDQDIFLGTGGGFAIAVVEALVSGGVSALFSKGTWVLYAFPGGGGEQLWWYVKSAGGDGFWGTSTLLPTGSKHIVSVAYDQNNPLTPPVIAIDGIATTIGTVTNPGGAITSDHGFSLETINNEVLSSNGNSFTGTLYEAMFFKGAVSAPNQALLVVDMKAFYSIP
jgi:hypothetical protein